MWWFIVPGIIAVVVLSGVLLYWKNGADRRRSATWNDLHERGKLIASQLAQLNRLRTGNEEPSAEAGESTKLEAKKKTGSFWPRRSIHRQDGEPSAIPVDAMPHV
jgi:hypothetical protein